MSSYKLSLLEQETIILFNREEKQAEVYTHEPSLKKKLDNLCKTSPDVFVKREDNGAGGVTYTLPKKLIAIRTPRPKKTLSEEEREALRERMAKIKLK
jgi:hypothetical protein